MVKFTASHFFTQSGWKLHFFWSNHPFMAKQKTVYQRKQYRRTFLKAWRLYRGLTLERLAERVGVQPSALSYLERGQSAYNQGMLEALAEALNVTPSHILEVDPTKDGEVIDLVRLIDDRNRDQAIRVLKALTGTDS